MYLTIHDIDRVLAPDRGDWAGDVLALLSRDGGEPAGSWICRQPGSSRGAVIALWPSHEAATAAASTEGSTTGRVTVSAADRLEVIDLDLGPDRSRTPAVARLAYFDGPRSAVQVAADRRSDDRVRPAIQTVPGYCGSVTGLAEDGGFVLVVLAVSAEALHEGERRIMSTELLPGEDPALLTGPDRMDLLSVVRATTQLSTLSNLLTGGVR
jgi:hypothetical protein